MSDQVTISLKSPIAGLTVRTIDQPDEGPWILELSNGQIRRIGRALGRALSLQAGDQLWFPGEALAEAGEPDLLDQRSVLRVRKAAGAEAVSRTPERTEIWYATIGYVGEPKLDKKKRYFVRAQPSEPQCGLQHLIIPCRVVQDYFYRLWLDRGWADQPQTWFEVLDVPPEAPLTQIVSRYRLRRLELSLQETDSLSPIYILDKVFNLLAVERTRQSVNRLLDAKKQSQPREQVPTRWPWSGYGRLAVSGHSSPEGGTLFVHRIHYYRPSRTGFDRRLPLAEFHFTEREAIIPGRGHLDIVFTREQLNLNFSSQWNLWKHGLDTGAGIHIQTDLIVTGRFAQAQGGAWKESRWREPVPSTLVVKQDLDLVGKMDGARQLYERIQQAKTIVANHRKSFPHKILTLTAIQQDLKKHGFGDLEPHRLFCKPGYDDFYYEYLQKKAETIYVYSGDLIFLLKNAIVIEVPGPGYATYVFRRPHVMGPFLQQYGQWHRQDVLQNHNRIGEKLGFIGRVNHLGDPKDWVEQMEILLGRTIPLGLARAQSQPPTPSGEGAANLQSNSP